MTEPTELAYDLQEPASLWVGTSAGSLFASSDEGVTFRAIDAPQLQSQVRPVEAITIDPRDAQTVYVGLGGVGNGEHDPGTLWKTTNGGASFAAIGRAELVEVDGTSAPVSPSTPLGINEIVIDPESSSRLWVATTAGVFESTDAGASFHVFSEGLPNTEVMDLTFVPGRRMLRCALWGRGTYARDVATAAPPPVQLYLRSSILDDGAVRPADDGPDVFSAVPSNATRWSSPDIKLSTIGYRELGASSLEVDAAEFDELIESEPVNQELAAPSEPHTVRVLVHNRSEQPATATRVILLWADCSTGIPDLPATFWPSIGGAVTVDAPWHSLGEVTIPGEVTARRARVADQLFTPPVTIGLDASHIGLLALVSCAQDTLTAGPRAIAELLAQERRAAFRLIATRTAREHAQLVLRASDGRPFTATETPAAWIGLAVGVATTAQRSHDLPRALDLSAAPVRVLTVSVAQPIGPPRVVTIRFEPAELRRLGIDPSAVRPAELRRFIDRALRLGPVGVRCENDAVQLSARGSGTSADLLASPTAFPDAASAAAALSSGAFLTLDVLKRSTTNDCRARVRNDGGAPEPGATFRAFWFDPAVAPITLDAAHQLTTSVLPLAPSAHSVIQFDLDPGAAPEAQRGVLIWLSSPGDPVRAPLTEPPAPAPSFPDVLALDAYCARHPNVAYRVMHLEDP